MSALYKAAASRFAGQMDGTVATASNTLLPLLSTTFVVATVYNTWDERWYAALALLCCATLYFSIRGFAVTDDIRLSDVTALTTKNTEKMLKQHVGDVDSKELRRLAGVVMLGAYMFVMKLSDQDSELSRYVAYAIAVLVTALL